MALIECKCCGKPVSDKAKVCPYCGKALLEVAMVIPKIKCEECGCELDIGMDICPNCGYSQSIPNNLIHRKKFGVFGKVAIVLVLVLSLAAFGVFQLVQNSGFSLNQMQTTFELGEKVELKKCVEYDTEKVLSVNVVDNGGFDSKKCGNYTVVYSVENKYGKTKEISLTFEVKDTIVPKVKLKEENLRVIKGKETNLNDFVEVEDNSNNCKVNIIGNYDFNKKGNYTLKVSATDESGNTSEEVTLTLSVEDRDNCVIRNAKFGDSMETVIAFEELEAPAYQDDDTLIYETTLDGLDVFLLYSFNERDQLYVCSYQIQEDYINYNYYIDDMNNLLNNLIGKYGDYDDGGEYKGGLYNYCSDKGQALQLGYLAYQYFWKLDDMAIKLKLQEKDDLSFTLLYLSTVYEAPKDDSNY